MYNFLTSLNDTDTCIYFLSDGQHVKIGFSSDTPQRLVDLQVGNALPLTLLALMLGNQETEHIMHMMFATDRKRGEWFKLSDAIVRFLDGHRIDLPVVGIQLKPKAQKQAGVNLDRRTGKPQKTDRLNTCLDCCHIFKVGELLCWYPDQEGKVACIDCHNDAVELLRKK